jgi:putative flippase GtrA
MSKMNVEKMNNETSSSVERDFHIVESIVLSIIRAYERLTGKKLDDFKKKSLIQFAKFCVVGLSNTLISYVLYSVALLIFRGFRILKGYDYIAAQVIQFILSVLWSYYWNNRYVFMLGVNEKRSFWKSLIKTYISYSFTGLFLSSVLLLFWVKILHISEFIAPILNLLISVPLNFIINKYWAFRSNKISKHKN